MTSIQIIFALKPLNFNVIFFEKKFFVSWAIRPFVRMKFWYSRQPLRIFLLGLYLSHVFYFRTEANYSNLNGAVIMLALPKPGLHPYNT